MQYNDAEFNSRVAKESSILHTISIRRRLSSINSDIYFYGDNEKILTKCLTIGEEICLDLYTEEIVAAA